MDTITGSILTDVLTALLGAMGIRKGAQWGLTRMVDGKSPFPQPLTKADIMEVQKPMEDTLHEMSHNVKELTTVLKERLPPPWAKG